MTIALTCKCSAQLEVDDAFAGKTILCPDCNSPLEIPVASVDPRQTSLLALLSLTMALVGAFTIIGTIAAVALGAFALMEIKKRPKKLAGSSYAMAGIVIGGIFTLLTLVLFLAPGILQVDSSLERIRWVGKLKFPPQDAEKNTELLERGYGFTIVPPSRDWGVLVHSSTYNNYEDAKSFVMIQPTIPAYLLVLSNGGFTTDLEETAREAHGILEHFRFSSSGTKWAPTTAPTTDPIEESEVLPVNDFKTKEMVLRKGNGKNEFTYYVKLFKKNGTERLFIVAGGLPSRVYKNEDNRKEWAKLKGKLVDSVKSFRFSSTTGPGGGL
ncbi:MAG: DUF4190 domain-containing protein [Gemmataceae bacterium]